MKEYIEREALEKDFNSRLNYLVAEYGRYDPYTRGFDDAVDRLEDAPAADVAEVRRGKNLCEDDPSRFECSECGWTCWDTYCGDTITYSFCPNCGADMRERDKV